ncbi:MAG: HAMP domain-containing histidine kinase [Synechococcales cyanobacterium C42_A2020_086]|jgi:signal transduction histidine kinase|nr:HAMP domain-containing histidine kinase [Synechococcales cyanobacterium C42_A2020_086]
MKLIGSTLNKLHGLRQTGIQQTSLQLRLTLGLTTLSLLGIGSIGTWTTWEMRQMLVENHKQHMRLVAQRVSQQIAIADPPLTDLQLQALLNDWSSSNFWIAVRPADQATLIESGALGEVSAEPGRALADASIKPEVHRLNGYRLVTCRMALSRNGRLMGQLYLMQNITHDYQVLTTLVNTLRLATLMAVLLIAALIAMFIRRSLRPLRQISQLAATQVTGDGTLPPLQSDLKPEQLPSELQEVTQAIGTLSTRLLEADERQREFTNSMSHELRTSLCLIYGYLQAMMRRGSNLTDSQREALEVATSETERTIQLLKDLLDLARLNSGTLELALQPVELHDLVATAVAQFQSLTTIPINVIPAASPLWVEADAAQLTRVLTHLLQNAARVSSPDQPIIVQLSQSSDEALLQISDQGCGIAPVEQERVFEPFYRVDASRCRSTGGVGLGLAIVKSLVEAMAGRVAVQSQIGVGSTFRVQLPLRQPQPS